MSEFSSGDSAISLDSPKIQSAPTINLDNLMEKKSQEAAPIDISNLDSKLSQEPLQSGDQSVKFEDGYDDAPATSQYREDEFPHEVQDDNGFNGNSSSGLNEKTNLTYKGTVDINKQAKAIVEFYDDSLATLCASIALTPGQKNNFKMEGAVKEGTVEMLIPVIQSRPDIFKPGRLTIIFLVVHTISVIAFAITLRMQNKPEKPKKEKPAPAPKPVASSVNHQSAAPAQTVVSETLEDQKKKSAPKGRMDRLGSVKAWSIDDNGMFTSGIKAGRWHDYLKDGDRVDRADFKAYKRQLIKHNDKEKLMKVYSLSAKDLF